MAWLALLLLVVVVVDEQVNAHLNLGGSACRRRQVGEDALSCIQPADPSWLRGQRGGRGFIISPPDDRHALWSSNCVAMMGVCTHTDIGALGAYRHAGLFGIGVPSGGLQRRA